MKNIEISKLEEKAIRWAVYLLKSKYADSQKALKSNVLGLMSQENVNNYQFLERLQNRLEVVKSHIEA